MYARICAVNENPPVRARIRPDKRVEAELAQLLGACPAKFFPTNERMGGSTPSPKMHSVLSLICRVPSLKFAQSRL